MPDAPHIRPLSEVQTDLEKVVIQLKATSDPNARQGLLRQMRILLKEADRAISRP